MTAALKHLFVLAHDELELPFLHQPVAILDHRRNLVGRVHVHERERDVAEERFARQPQQHGRILADAPEHREVLKLVERLAQDVNALVFEFRKIIHSQFCLTLADLSVGIEQKHAAN